MNRIEKLCDMCYEGGVDKEVFVEMTQYFLLNMADPSPVIIRHIDYLTEQETLISSGYAGSSDKEELEKAKERDNLTPTEVYNEREMIANMKEEYVQSDCPSWRRLEIQQDLSTYNELVPNLPLDDE